MNRLAIIVVATFAVVAAVPPRSIAQGKEDVTKLIKQMSDNDEFVRLRAAKTLGKLGASARDAIPYLTKALEDSDADVRRVAQQALSSINEAVKTAGNNSLFESLQINEKLATDKDPENRKKGAIGLGKLLTASDDVVRLRAAKVLSRMGIEAEPTMQSLKEATKDGDAAVRRLARTALDSLEEAIRERETERTLDKLKPIIKGLAAKDVKTRLKSVEAIADLGDNARLASESLVIAMMDASPQVAKLAAETLHNIEPELQVHVFTVLYGNDKEGAVRSLVKMKRAARPAIPALLRLYKALRQTNDVSDLRAIVLSQSVLASIAQIAPDDSRLASVVLSEITTIPIQNGVPSHRSSALSLLGTIKAENKAKMKVLMIALKDGHETVRVIEGIGSLGLDASDAVPALRKLRFSRNDQVRAAALAALKAIE